MAVKIAVVERKGGVGKTTLAAHIGAALALEGEKVLLIDTDSQGDLSRVFNQTPEDGLYEWLVNGRHPIYQLPRISYDPAADESNMWENPNLFLLPSHTQTWGIPIRIQDPFVMMERMAALDSEFGVILVDTAPTYSMLDATIYMAVDYFLFVTECEALSMNGVREGIASVQRFADRRKLAGQPASAVMGIVPNKMRPGINNHRANIAILAEEFGSLVWPPISQRAKWAECSNFGELLFRYAPDSVEAGEARALGQRVSEVLNVGA